MKPLSPAKRNFRSRFVVVFCIFVPMMLALFMTTSDKGLPSQPIMWNVRINGIDPKTQSMLIVDSLNPLVRITGFKAKDGNYIEFQMMLRSTIISNALFKTASPDVSTVAVTVRDKDGKEEFHRMIVVNASQPKVDVKLGPPVGEPAP